MNDAANLMLPDRRVFVAGLASLAGCAGIGGLPPGPGPVPTAPFADAHVHLFNASDLPVDAFLQYVVLPERYPTPPRWAIALVHLFATFYRPRAVTVAAERGRRATEWTADRFGREIAAHVRPLAEDAADSTSDPRTRGSGTAADDPAALSQSYRALLAELAAEAGGRTFAKGSDAAMFATIAQDVDRGVDTTGDTGSAAIDPSTAAVSSLGDVTRLIGWGYLMLQSRGRHVETYIKRFAMPGRSARVIVNHLVDYDLWLDEGPVAGSSHVDQIMLMDEIARRHQSVTTIRTFAGYCPLKHAIQRQTGGVTHFDTLKALARSGRIAGFKLYPPMGFQAYGNSALGDQSFAVDEPGRRGPLAAWRATGSARPLGEALDDALADFYRFCVSEKLPIMAHAAASNGAGPGFKDRANPTFWKLAVEAFPVRLSLGHLIGEPAAFVASVNAKLPPTAGPWTLKDAMEMMSTKTGGHAVYGDLAYSPELVASPSLATAFFKAVLEVFGPEDENLTRILYGTDWVMFGQESNDTAFLRAISTAMEAAGLSPLQRENILYNNARRFLALP